MVEERTVSIPHGLLKAENVTDRSAFAFLITEEPTVRIRGPFTRKSDGGQFEIMELVWEGEQIYPHRNSTASRTLTFQFNETQMQALLAGEEPRMSTRSNIGRLTEQLNRLSLGYPDDPDMQGTVLAIISDRNNRDQLTYEVVAHFGDRTNFDLDKIGEWADAENAGTKKEAVASY